MDTTDTTTTGAVLYGLSTCSHCKKAQEYLEKCNVCFQCVVVDTLQGDDRKNALSELRKHNPRLSFPTLVVAGGEKVLVGFWEHEFKEALQL